jgi:hypothetical protein
MTSQPLHSEESSESLVPVAGEFLEALLETEDPRYPWNPADPEAEAYFEALEKKFGLLEGVEADEIASQANLLFAQLHQCWDALNTQRKAGELSFGQQFRGILPVTWLETICQKAEQVIETNLSPIDQLVACVQPLLSNWAQEDLQVFARPFAYVNVMRGSQDIKQAPWDELSEIEKIRLSLQVAQEVLLQLQANKRQ